LYLDSEEIKADDIRSEEMAKLFYTLSSYAGKHVTLPPLKVLVELFGQVSRHVEDSIHWSEFK